MLQGGHRETRSGWHNIAQRRTHTQRFRGRIRRGKTEAGKPRTRSRTLPKVQIWLLPG